METNLRNTGKIIDFDYIYILTRYSNIICLYTMLLCLDED